MGNEQALRLIKDGLTLRKVQRQAAEQESRMEAYEKQMITFLNENCANAKKSRHDDALAALAISAEAIRLQEQRTRYIEQKRMEREQLKREWDRDWAVWGAVKVYAVGCMIVMLVTVWTPFPWWAAVALMGGMVPVTGAYIFRQYYPTK